MGKKSDEFNYSAMNSWLPGMEVNLGLNTGGVVVGKVEYADANVVVIVKRPTSSLDLETKNVYTVVKQGSIDYIQFTTERG